MGDRRRRSLETTLRLLHSNNKDTAGVTFFSYHVPITTLNELQYNADLLEIWEGREPQRRPWVLSLPVWRLLTTSGRGTEENDILTYSTSTEENIKILGRLHVQCETWARRRGSTFAPKKYEPIHLARNPKFRQHGRNYDDDDDLL